jgi:hypothetical protein
MHLLWPTHLAYLLGNRAFGASSGPSAIVWTVFLVAPVAVFSAWLIGALARPSLQTRSASALERLQDRPENGFEVWSRLPDGGLRPSPPMRLFVTTLSRSTVKASPFELVCAGASVILIVCLWAFDDALVRLLPAAVAEHRFSLGFAAVALLTIQSFRGWATEQRAHLAPI